ncbi:hypothetical protein DKX38_017621 [Salix brachista]|uniref:FYVE-type domain-containing protein n=1 Tax=Salix brachista TaxID=2182728 RepID=A0A5N5KVR2_9ROSI|nr:hypothetical protein DKX38_017621 [Salix brachista]
MICFDDEAICFAVSTCNSMLQLVQGLCDLQDEAKQILKSIYEEMEEHRCKSKMIPKSSVAQEDRTLLRKCESEASQPDTANNGVENALKTCHSNQVKVFFYDTPHSEETGVWIPVSVPPMSESEHQEWIRGVPLSGGCFPDEDLDWNQLLEKNKELTMWDVVAEMLVAARGKVSAIASGDVHRCGISWISDHLLEHAWSEMAQTLTEANFGNSWEILEAEPPKWLADSSASACMLCNLRFHPIMCSRHHCRFCGGIFCNECSKGRSLLPKNFLTRNPQRVCDVCCVRLESVQSYLKDHESRAAQLPTQDLTDLSTLRSWLNFPWGQSMEHEIYKATNSIQGYAKVGSLSSEKSIPDAILKQAKGLAILTIAKVGVIVTYNIGTGLVVSRREDGSWSPPSAISSFGMGWGAQKITDFVVALFVIIDLGFWTFGTPFNITGYMYMSELLLTFRCNACSTALTQIEGLNVALLLCIKSRDFVVDCTSEHVAIEAVAAMEIGIIERLYTSGAVLLKHQAMVGGEFTDFIIVLRTMGAVKTFSGNLHFSVGAGLSAAVGIVGRAAEADLRAGDGGLATCYTYSCSKGAFVGCSLEGSILATRTRENARFYGASMNASDILLGSLPGPPAASMLYDSLSNLFGKLER